MTTATKTPAEFDAALQTWIERAQGIIADHFEANGFNWKPDQLSTMVGRRYIRVVRTSNQRSVHCFIDRENGDVLKAAGWKGPAKGARGNIFDPTRLGVGPHGAQYVGAITANPAESRRVKPVAVQTPSEKAMAEKPKPKVGDGVTYSVGSDRYAGTIVSVSPSGHRFEWTDDDAKPTANHEPFGSQEYTYTPNPDGRRRVATRRDGGHYVLRGTNYGYVRVGERRTYRDPSF